MNRQIATFYIGKILFGVDILLVKEIYRHTSMTRIPDAPKILAGLMNLRGRVVTVIDLRLFLNHPVLPAKNETKLLIMKTQEEINGYIEQGTLDDNYLGDDIAGFIIDRMDDVRTVGYKDILPPPPNLLEADESLIEGVVKKKEDLLIILNVPVVLEKTMRAVSEKSRTDKTMQKSLQDSL